MPNIKDHYIKPQPLSRQHLPPTASIIAKIGADGSLDPITIGRSIGVNLSPDASWKESDYEFFKIRLAALQKNSSA